MTTQQGNDQLSNDPVFNNLISVKSSLSKNNQELIPALIKLFGDFRIKIVSDLNEKFNNMTDIIKEECLTACKAKDEKILELQAMCTTLQGRYLALEDKLDATEAYERKDTIIISGKVPAVTEQEHIKDVTINLLNSKLSDVQIEPHDISICHRLQQKRTSPGQAPKPPNIYVKLVRRDLKHALIRASKKQPKQALNKIFVNESLTPARSKIFHTLMDLKKNNDAIKGVTSMEGDVYAYTAGPPDQTFQVQGRTRDTRHRINNRRDLQKFCDDHLRKPLEELLDYWTES